MMKRRADWEQRLFAFLNEARGQTFDWGTFDCATGLAAGAVEAQTGQDLAAEFRGLYEGEAAAIKLLKREGWLGDDRDFAMGMEAMMDAFLKRAPKGRRHRGNIVLLETEEGPGLTVRVGAEVVGMSRSGGTRLFKPPVGAPEWTVAP